MLNLPVETIIAIVILGGGSLFVLYYTFNRWKCILPRRCTRRSRTFHLRRIFGLDRM